MAAAKEIVAMDAMDVVIVIVEDVTVMDVTVIFELKEPRKLRKW